jgi:SNF2 family DNA or RNA helicase
MTTVQRLREVCDTPEMLFPEHKASAKLNELKTILGEQVGQLGRRAIVFTQWTRMAEILARELTAWGLSYRYMHGAVKPRDRTRIVNEFNAGDAQVFLSTDAGSTGINLQAASIVVNFDLPFNPAVVDQRVARAHRHGQKSSVNAIHLVMRGTIEEHLVKILNRRRELFKDIMSEVGDAIFPMTPSASSRVFLIELLGQRVPSL